MEFTARQGEYLAFIDRYTARRGVAPSFEEIGAHFGTTPPSVNGMIKTLVRRGLLSSAPGKARSLRVLVPASQLPGSEFDSRRRSTPGEKENNTLARPVAHSPTDAATAAAVAVMGTLMNSISAGPKRSALVLRCGSAVATALAKNGLTQEEATEVSQRIAAEWARWEPTGRGTYIPRRVWRRR